MSHAVVPFEHQLKLAEAFAKSGLFGIKDANQALALMALCEAEGIHPSRAVQDFDIIQGKPAKKSQAMLSSFLSNGGSVEWHERTDTKCSATFKHPQGGTLCIEWDMERAAKAGLGSKDNWKKWPRQMLSARVVSEGVRAVFPSATSGLYVPEEITDFDDKKPRKEKEINPLPVALKDVLSAIAAMRTKTEREAAKALADRLTDADQITMAEAAWAQRLAELKNPPPIKEKEPSI